MVRGNSAVIRLLLAVVCAGHAVTGFAALLSGKPALRFGAAFYGARFEPSSQFLYIIRPLGAFMLGLAYLHYLAFLNPWQYRRVIDATLLVFALRQFQRIAFRRDAYAAFGIPPRRHWTLTLSLQVLAAALFLARLALRPPGEAATTGTSDPAAR
ncbi:MAG: hypothetical protein HY689_03335 [Chloroflexi bacterium]|nr:hypothetical protein [Chloroflexota bacterium]